MPLEVEIPDSTVIDFEIDGDKFIVLYQCIAMVAELTGDLDVIEVQELLFSKLQEYQVQKESEEDISEDE